MATVLTDEGRAARRAYKREWDSKHKEHNKIYQAKYWNAKVEELKAAENKRKK
ncbi:hypothetical protein [Clostridium sp. C2-6-12]|uniref:hypothetical protein n=1 Tax=Clostridium sp. C2-6-12 TaxID=2698832 RepID=UPI001370BD65|nr:hypothetical protein [Clostridium sp. C2-6-12]